MYEPLLKEIPEKEFRKEALRRRMMRSTTNPEDENIQKKKRQLQSANQDIINRRKQGLGY